MTIYPTIAAPVHHNSPQGAAMPSDAEIKELAEAFGWNGWSDQEAENQRIFVRIVLARWGAPQAAALPARVSLTQDQVWANEEIMGANACLEASMQNIMRLVRAVEDFHGITSKAEGAKNAD